MLNRLVINNLAIFENIDISFKDGFSVLMGETGAGKSLMIDSLSLLLGARASSELIRQGANKATVKGYFSISRPELNAYLNKINVPNNDDEIVIERNISPTKNVVKINGVNVSLNDLIYISKFIANIHSQFDFEKILNPENYLDIIDGFSADLTNRLKEEYKSLLNEYKQKKKDYEDLLTKKEKINEARDFYEYQYKELKGMQLSPTEEDEISSELALLKNYDKIYSLINESKEIINGTFMDDFYSLKENISKLSSYQKQYEETYKVLDDHYYALDDVLSSLKKEFRNLDYDPNRLDELETRDSELSALKRKYKKSIPELISYLATLEKMIGKDSSFEEEIKAKEDECNSLLKDTLVKAEELTLIRQRNAKKIEKELTNTLKDLLLNVRFEILFKETKKDETSLKENGIDDVDFLIETNIGEGLKPLAKVISGGEASRIMLAFKTPFIKANKIPTIIFDEIDTGISGETAQAVARKIKEISLSTQVISITHMPQVASLSDHHILISKEVRDGRTFSSVKELTLEEKIRQIAYLISGGKVTEKQLEYAKEMILGSN